MSAPHEHPTGEELLRHASWIRGLARGLVGDEATAEDVVQDTWVAALTHPPPAEGKLRPWLRQVARNFARQDHRGRARRAARESGARGPSPTPTPDELGERLDMERRLTDEMARLEEPYRSTLMLRYYEDLEPADIAAHQGIPGGTVRWRLKRGLELLRSRLDAAHGGDRRAWSLLVLPLARPKVAAATGVAGASVAVPGVLAMNGFLKIGAAAAVVVVVALGLAGTGVLPASLLPWPRAEQPMAVGFRPVSPAAGLAQAEPSPAPPPVQPSRAAADWSSPDEVVEQAAVATGEIVARVVDVHGAPLAGAQVTALTRSGRIGPATSDQDGALRLDVPVADGRERDSVHFAAAGYASQARTVVVERGGSTHAGTIELAPGGVVSGRVVDPSGDPVPGARVTIGEVDLPRRRLEALRLEHPPGGPPECATDAHGEFRLRGVPIGHVRLWARGEGMLPGFTPPVEVREGQESFGVEVVLRELADGHLIRGLVLDPLGAPIRFADLDYRHSSKRGGRSISGDERAGEDGRFEFVLFRDERLWITARDPEGRYGPGSASGVEAGELDLVLQLVEAQRIALVVLDPDGGAVEHFGFDVLSADEELTHQSADSGARQGGRADFRLPSGAFRVRVTAPGYAVGEVGPLAPGAVAGEVEVRLVSVPGIRGVVLADGEPVPGALVKLQEMVGEDRSIVQNGFPVRVRHEVLDEARTDEQGRFLITARAAGDYLLRAEHSRLAPADEGPVRVGRDLKGPEVRIRMSSGGAIEGRVFLADGSDPAGSIVGISRGDGYGKTRRVGEDGRYLFERLTPGSWTVELRDEEILEGYMSITSGTGRGAKPFDETAQDCEVFAGQTTYHDLRLAPEESWPFEGRLTVNGEPAEAWTATLTPLGSALFQEGPTAVMDADGRFVVNTPGPGAHRLVLHGPFEAGTESYLMDEVTVGASAKPWRLDLETGSLQVEGLEPWSGDGMPPLVYVWDGPGEATCLAPIGGDADGRCELSGIPAGPGRLVVPNAESMDPEDWRSLREVDIPAGGEAVVSLLH